MTQVSNERYSAILAEADRAHDIDEITLADNHLIVKKLNEGEFETAEKMLTDAKELTQFGNRIKTGDVVRFTEKEIEYIGNYILNEPLTNQICLNYWTHIRNRCWSRLNQRNSDWAYNNRYRMFRRLGFKNTSANVGDDSIILDFVVGFSFSNDLPVLIKKYIMTLLKSYDYPNENPENPLELSFHVIDADTHIILHDDHKSLEEAIGGNMMSNIWKSFIMTVKRRNNVPANYKFNPDVIPPMFDPTTAMEILLNRRKNPVYLSDIFTVEKYLTEEEKKEKEKREKEEADKKLDKKLDKLRLIYLELARVPPGTTHPEVWENINNIRSKNIHDMFTHLCQMKRLDLAKELYDISLKKGNWVDIRFNFTFACSCNCANIDVLQWLLQIKPDIDISYNDELAFTLACRHGNLEIAKWLLQIKPDIKIPKRAISNARFWKHTEIVNWLLQIKPDIDT